MELLYQDKNIVVCVKPIGVESEDNIVQNSTQNTTLNTSQTPSKKKQAETMPSLLRAALGLPPDAHIFTVHRLDKQVSGVMVYAKTKKAAASLSTQMQAHQFTKEYRAVIEGTPTPPKGRWEDLLYHDKRKNKVFAVKKERKGVKQAALRYATLATVAIDAPSNSATIPMEQQSKKTTVMPTEHPMVTQVEKTMVTPTTPLSLLQIELETGRTHQIRVQSASRKHPLIGDARYGSQVRGCDIALFSHKIGFYHPITNEFLTFTKEVPNTYPWVLF